MKPVYFKEIVLLVIVGLGLWWWQDGDIAQNKTDKSQLQQQMGESIRLIKDNLTKPPVLTTRKIDKTISIEQAQTEKKDKVQVTGEGTVIKTLPDDDNGSRHQRFILQTTTGTVLIVHNIDIAPRLEGLQRGDNIAFSGEFINNDRGGFVHWTHHDPVQRHTDGWLRYQGQTFK